MIPSEGTVKVIRSAERYIRQASSGKAVSVSVIQQFVRAEIGSDDVFLLKEHIEETQFGIDNHHFSLLSLVVSVFHKLRLHHIAKLSTLKLQSGNSRKKLGKSVLSQGFQPVQEDPSLGYVIYRRIWKNIYIYMEEKLSHACHCQLNCQKTPVSVLTSFYQLG